MMESFGCVWMYNKRFQSHNTAVRPGISIETGQNLLFATRLGSGLCCWKLNVYVISIKFVNFFNIQCSRNN